MVHCSWLSFPDDFPLFISIFIRAPWKTSIRPEMMSWDPKRSTGFIIPHLNRSLSFYLSRPLNPVLGECVKRWLNLYWRFLTLSVSGSSTEPGQTKTVVASPNSLLSKFPTTLLLPLISSKTNRKGSLWRATTVRRQVSPVCFFFFWLLIPKCLSQN